MSTFRDRQFARELAARHEARRAETAVGCLILTIWIVGVLMMWALIGAGIYYLVTH